MQADLDDFVGDDLANRVVTITPCAKASGTRLIDER
jgi:hypothetical protein